MDDDDLVLLEELGAAAAGVAELLTRANDRGFEIPAELVDGVDRLIEWVAARP